MQEATREVPYCDNCLGDAQHYCSSPYFTARRAGEKVVAEQDSWASNTRTTTCLVNYDYVRDESMRICHSCVLRQALSECRQGAFDAEFRRESNWLRLAWAGAIVTGLALIWLVTRKFALASGLFLVAGVAPLILGVVLLRRARASLERLNAQAETEKLLFMSAERLLETAQRECPSAVALLSSENTAALTNLLSSRFLTSVAGMAADRIALREWLAEQQASGAVRSGRVREWREWQESNPVAYASIPSIDVDQHARALLKALEDGERQFHGLTEREVAGLATILVRPRTPDGRGIGTWFDEGFEAYSKHFEICRDGKAATLGRKSPQDS